ELTDDRLDHGQGPHRPTSWRYVAVTHARQGNEAEVSEHEVIPIVLLRMCRKLFAPAERSRVQGFRDAVEMAKGRPYKQVAAEGAIDGIRRHTRLFVNGTQDGRNREAEEQGRHQMETDKQWDSGQSRENIID